MCVCVSVDFVYVLWCLFRSDVCVYGLCMYLCLLPFLSVVCVVNRVCWYWTALRDVPRCPKRGCWKPLSYLRGVCMCVVCVCDVCGVCRSAYVNVDVHAGIRHIYMYMCDHWSQPTLPQHTHTHTPAQEYSSSQPVASGGIHLHPPRAHLHPLPAAIRQGDGRRKIQTSSPPLHSEHEGNRRGSSVPF